MNYEQKNLAPGLYLVGVPIGTARDITLRALDVLASADLLAAEDTRSLRKLLDIHAIPLKDRRIVALHDHSGQGTVAWLVDQMAAGKSLAYASEAGMPLIADPGFELVRAARAAGVAATSAPGPSSVTTALALGGIATDAFHFVGFLPAKTVARDKAIQALGDIPATLVLFETAKRAAAVLEAARQILGDQRMASICRELTKRFEDVRHGTLAELCDSVAASPLKGEIVLLIDRERGSGVREIFLDDMIESALKEVSIRDAAHRIAEETGLKRRDVYQRALALAAKRDEDSSR